MALSLRSALIAYRIARVLPIIPLAIGAVALVGCAKVVSDVRKTRPLTTLAGSEWGLRGTDQFISFKSEGEVNGNGGCNIFFGSYTQEGNAITFGPLASTKKACQGKMKAEALFLNSIQKTRAYDATHLEMTLLDEDDKIILRLERRDWD